MTDRNSQRSIEIDIEFIEDIQEAIDSNYLVDALELLDDWKDELIGMKE